MQIEDIDRVRRDRIAAGGLYQEFLRTGSMSGGLYELPAGAADPQQPHRSTTSSRGGRSSSATGAAGPWRPAT